jgi:rare lipoprotein A
MIPMNVLRFGVGVFVVCLAFLLVGRATASEQCGKASWYALGGTTASGERANPSGLTAAHRTLPFGTLVRVENLRNGRTVMVRVNDRGPFRSSRIIDVTKRAAEQLGFRRAGVARVRISVPEKSGTLRNNC